MYGLNLSREYYNAIVWPLIKDICPKLLRYSSIGLVGEGSECYGYDDEISRDHDFRPRICIWVSQKRYRQFQRDVEEILDKAEKQIVQGEFTPINLKAEHRSGLMATENFYRYYTGKPHGPENWKDWIKLPSHFLSTATNGEIFLAGDDEFMATRHRLKAFFPEDVRLKKLTTAIGKMAQAGQYNYYRAVLRKDKGTEFATLSVFIKYALQTIFLLKKQYMPYYKWSFRALNDLSDTGIYVALLNQIINNGVVDSELNERCIEKISETIRKELQEQKLTQSDDKFLMDHLSWIHANIKDKDIAKLPFLYEA